MRKHVPNQAEDRHRRKPPGVFRRMAGIVGSHTCVIAISAMSGLVAGAVSGTIAGLPGLAAGALFGGAVGVAAGLALAVEQEENWSRSEW